MARRTGRMAETTLQVVYNGNGGTDLPSGSTEYRLSVNGDSGIAGRTDFQWCC